VKVRRINLVLPARLRHSAHGDAREIAAAVAQALSRQGAVSGPLRIEVAGAGRPARHMTHDIAAAMHRAAGACTKREA
jgi:hypothetical protein